MTRRELRAAERRQRSLRERATSHLRTPATTGTDMPALLRHTSPRRAALAAVVVCLALALLAPLLLLTSFAPGSPQRLKRDPAVAALLTYEAGLDGSPAGRAAAERVVSSLTSRTLSDGTVKLSRVGLDGYCYYLLVPADAAQPTSGVRTGVPADCAA